MIRKLFAKWVTSLNVIFSKRYDWQENCTKRCERSSCRQAVRVTCKIHRQVIGRDLVVLRVSGRLAGDDVDTLRALLEEERGRLTLDLKDVR